MRSTALILSVLGLALLAGCEEGASSQPASSTPPAGTTTDSATDSGGRSSALGKSMDAAERTVEQANEYQKKVGEAAGDADGGG